MTGSSNGFGGIKSRAWEGASRGSGRSGHPGLAAEEQCATSVGHEVEFGIYLEFW